MPMSKVRVCVCVCVCVYVYMRVSAVSRADVKGLCVCVCVRVCVFGGFGDHKAVCCSHVPMCVSCIVLFWFV